MTVPLVERDAVRAILLTPGREVLLLRISEPGRAGIFWWITPGGGLEPGESAEAGLRRELLEEVGLLDFALGPLVWRRQHTFDWVGRRVCQRERYHIVHVDRFTPRMTDPVEARVVDRFRWWPLDELAASPEPLTPRSLESIVRRYLSDGAPRGPVDVEVLVD